MTLGDFSIHVNRLKSVLNIPLDQKALSWRKNNLSDTITSNA